MVSELTGVIGPRDTRKRCDGKPKALFLFHFKSGQLKKIELHPSIRPSTNHMGLGRPNN